MSRALLLLLVACKSAAPGVAPGDDAPVPGDVGDDGDAPALVDAAMVDAHENLACPDPAPPAVANHTLVVDVPSDFDPTANPTPTTTIAFTIMLPRRCPGDAFPLVLGSHGYGGTRITALAPDATLHSELPHFPAIDALVAALPHHGYVVITFDERGHGESGGNARVVDPAAETRDARALLDWAYANADANAILREPASGIPDDIRVGTIGYSYGGAFQLPLAALDARVDTIVPNGTWHDLLYSLMPGDSVKLSFDGLLCLLAQTGGVANTPIVQTLCNAVGIQSATASTNRSRADLASSVSGPTALPRRTTEAELVGFLAHHGMGYFRRKQLAGQAWGFGEPAATLRPIPALFVQGNRDVLFNLTEAVWNARYFAEAGGDVRLLSTEGGHMNPLARQTEGTASCGDVDGLASILAWFDRYLKDRPSAAFDAIPRVCLSVAASQGAPAAPAGLALEQVPIGSQAGVPAKLGSASANLPLGTIAPVFVPVKTMAAAGVLAGVPTIGVITVTAGTGAGQSTNAFVGVGIRRGNTTFLVDDQITAFTAGTHARNRNVLEDDRVWLPAVGEQLQTGDVVGLLLFPSHVQYAAVVAASSIPGLPNVVTYVGGVAVPPITSGLEPLTGLTYVNPYSVTLANIELPILAAD